MKLPFKLRAPAVDTRSINQTIQRALASAGLDTSSGPLKNVTETIRRALSPAAPDDNTQSRTGKFSGPVDVVDVDARVVSNGGNDDVGASDRSRSDHRTPAAGTFETRTFRNAAGSRSYKLYIPQRPWASPPPVLVMLHGCTQSADDFAVGTGMNKLADEHGILVVYPEQPASANASRCWNWFRPEDQLRESGEPSIIAGIAREVARLDGVDSQRIFVAGLSAGAAMAVVMGETYPELFAGVGAHSGLPFRSASDIPSAMAAMKGGRSGMPGLKSLAGQRPGRQAGARQPVPTIVFHGNRDHTVQQDNGAEIFRQACAAQRAHAGNRSLTSRTHDDGSAAGRPVSVDVLADASGSPLVESWTIEGAGHAWSGGDPRGTYTDRNGPDASAQMLRFFLALPRHARGFH